MNSHGLGRISLGLHNITAVACNDLVEMFVIAHNVRNESHERLLLLLGICLQVFSPRLDEYPLKALLQWTVLHPYFSTTCNYRALKRVLSTVSRSA